MKKIKFTAVLLCLTTMFALFTGSVYAQNGDSIYIDETTLVIKDGKVVSGDASLVDGGFIVIGEPDEDDVAQAEAEPTPSGKQPVKDDTNLTKPDGSTGTPSDVTLPTENPKYTSFSPNFALVARQSPGNITNNWGAYWYDLMLLHGTRKLVSNATYTMNIATLARGEATGNAATYSAAANNDFTGELFHVSSGTLNITHGDASAYNDKRVTLEGLRVHYTTLENYTGTDGVTIKVPNKSQINNINRWSCTNHSYASYNDWNNPTEWFSPLIVVDGGKVNIYDTQGVTIRNNVCGESGGAVKVTSGTLDIKNTTISHCKTKENGGAIYVGANGKAVIDGCTFDGNVAVKNGGAIYVVSGGELTITNTTIKNCQAAHGGAIYLAGDCTVNFASVTIQNNTVSGNGGAIWVGTSTTVNHTGGTFSGNKAESGVGGAIALARHATYNLKGGTISNNKAENGGGIGCYGDGTSNTGSPDFNMESGTMSGNEATMSGGAIHIRCGNGHSISGGTITGNKSPQGAGVYVYNGSASYPGTVAGRITISSNANIYKNGNSNTTHGGGVYVGSGGTLAITGGTIGGTSVSSHANEAGYGGGVYVTGGTVTMTGGKINANKARSNGGGIDMSSSTVTMSAGEIKLNQANNGGAVHCASGCTLGISGGTVSGNTAAGSGGAIAAGGGTVNISGSANINLNTATNKGGGVYMNSSTVLNFTGGIIGGTSVASHANSAKTGGGIHMEASTTLNMSGSSKVSFNKVTGTDSAGGGIYATGACIINITGSTTAGACAVSGNTADYRGGGFYLYNITTADNIKINNVTIDGNVAKTDRGGGMWINFSATNKDCIVRISGAVISNNTAEPVNSTDTDCEGHGGGIYQANCKLYIDRCSFTGNTASIRGGGLYCTSNTVTEVKNSSFTGNKSEGLQSGTAYGRGGGMYVYDNADVTVINTTFDGNISNTHAGAIGSNGDTSTTAKVTLVDVTIGGTTANKASGNGGGVYASTNSILNIVRGTVSKSEAKYGAGIFAEGATTTVAISNNTNISGVAATGANVSINGNTATSEGGGIWIGEIASISIENTDIDGNKTTSGHGGGIYAGRAVASPVSIKNCNIRNNSASNDGGGLYTLVSDGAKSLTVNFTGTNVITGNVAGDYGGGAIIRSNTTVNVNTADNSTTTIDNNQAGNGGGGIHVAAYGTLNMTGGTISGNHGPLDASGTPTSCRGAGVDVTGGTASLKQLTMANNKAGTYGGGFSASDYGTFSTVVLEDLTVDNNFAGMGGGGIYVVENTDLTITSTAKDAFKIINNRAALSGSTDSTVGFGGGMLVHDLKTDAILELTNLLIKDNTASTNGGGLYVGGYADVEISYSSFDGNKATNGSGGGLAATDTAKIATVYTYFGNNQANNGGGVAVLGNGFVKLEDGCVGCLPVDMAENLENVAIARNIATSQGGGIFVAAGGTITFQGNVAVCNNRAGYDNDYNLISNGAKGGGIVFAAGSTVNFGESDEDVVTVNDNAASGDGGGMYVEAGFDVANLIMTGNNAASGGGIYVNDATVNIDNTGRGETYQISYNTARSGNGGGILVTGENGSLTANNGFVIGNTASGSFNGDTAKVASTAINGTGGGVAVFDGGSFELVGGAIYGNTASVAGNDVFANGEGTNLKLPAPDDMTVNHEDYQDGMWFEDYMTGDKSYAEGLNGDSRSIERYALSPISVRAYTSSAEVDTIKDRYINDANQFVAITFNIPKYSVGSIQITAPTANDENQVFVYTITGETTLGDRINLSISIPAGETVKITELIAGSYTVTQQTAWSWRYDTTPEDEVETAPDGSVIISITGAELDEIHEIRYTGDKVNNQWLSHNSPVVPNRASTLPTTVVHTFDIVEANKDYII